MARKNDDGKKGGGKKSIIQLNPGKQDNDSPFQDWDEDEDLWDEDDDGWDEDDTFTADLTENLMSALMGRLMGDGGGMTNEQYKGMLLDSLQPWKEVLKLAQEAGNQQIVEKAKAQISLINKKLKF